MDRLGVPAAAPTHIQHVASQYSMELLSDDCYQQESDLEGDLKSRGSSGIGSGLDTPPLLASGEWQYHSKSPGGRVGGEEDFDGTMPELCSVNLQDYINDFDEFLPHDEAMRGGGDPVKVSVYDHQQPESTDEGCMGEDVCMSTYERWKKLSGPMLIFIVILLVVLVWGRGHLIDLLEWLEHLPLYESTPVFIVLFTFVSFPFGFGNLILNLTAGYLYGFVYGQLIVMVSVAVGLSVAFELCRRWFRGYARSITTSKALQAVLRVVEGPHGFKVIFLTRFTPIPFGLQNVVFSVSPKNMQVCANLGGLYTINEA